MEVWEALQLVLAIVGAIAAATAAPLWRYIGNLRKDFAARADAVTLEQLRVRIQEHDVEVRTYMQTALGTNQLAYIREVEGINRGILEIKDSMKEAASMAASAHQLGMGALHEAQMAHAEIKGLDRRMTERVDRLERMVERRAGTE